MGKGLKLLITSNMTNTITPQDHIAQQRRNGVMEKGEKGEGMKDG